KGYEIQRGKYIPLTKTDLEKLEFKAGRLIEIFQFVDLDNLDPIYFDNSYYLVPDANGEKPYFLLRQALEEYNKIALGRFVFHEKEHLVALRPYEGAVLMETLHYADEIRTPGEFNELKTPVTVDKDELELAGQLIRILKKPFAYKEYKDRYQEALGQLVEAKSKGEELVEVKVPEIKPTKDLMETLKASIRAQGRR
ncbi:MAG TPA: Ku protein, partial [Candidatus Binatus sp.]|nr:Ku protein [Candidatus Binatus sp.]